MKRLLSYLGAALAVTLLIVAPASADTSSSGLSISPRKNLNIQPGGSVADKLTITNLNDQQDLNITFKIRDFTFTDQTGTPRLFLADDAPQTTWSLKPFMTLPKSIVIPKGQSKTVNYTVNIPKSQGAGSYYSAIQYQATGASGANVNLSASGVTLVFVSVPGVVNENMELKKLGAYQNKADNTVGKFVFIAMDKPKQIGYSLQNSGNVAESPVGSMTIKPMFGKAKTIDNINRISSLALIGQTRLFLTCIETEQQQVQFQGSSTTANKCKSPSLIPGRYTVTADIFYGQNGNATHEIQKISHFWYLPTWFLLAILAAVLYVSYQVWKLRRRLNRSTSRTGYNRQVRPRR